ncbi:ABC transporter permease [Spiroplasma cantharicola]|uniref:Uncharacterized protein n=1 Tax=Spiroplasma cantharicola TaxID=362837 RepID=A0A0M3SJD7_9MOLU|nr:ABC transporter permease [Spiroplasma cantharicola]ALD66554.1 hypothetical protein SCANT_v1c06480 [Spiroplasma cantharicola]
MKSIIPGFSIIKYSFKSIIKEKSFLIFNGLYLLFSLFIACYSLIQKNNSNFLQVFDYYVILSIFVILFVLCLRLTQYFYVVKRDDKTLNIIITQQLSRSKLFLFQFISFILLMLINIFISYLLINIINMAVNFKANLFLLRLTTVYLIYAFLSCVFLINFFLLISLLSNIQVSTIIATLILSATFISNLPYTFLIQSEESQSKKITFLYKNSNTSMSVNEIYDSYNLKKQILNKEIRYSNLSFEIYNNFINNEFETDPNAIETNFNNEKNIQKRMEFWTEMGIAEKKNTVVELKQPTKIVTVNNSTNIAKWKGDQVTFSFQLAYNFLTIDELKNELESESLTDEQKLFVKDFIDFTEFIININDNFQETFSNLFDPLVILEDEQNIRKNYISNVSSSSEPNLLFDKKYLVDIYQSYFSYSNNKLSLESSKIRPIIEEKLFSPTMLSARILEQYFIRYTNNLVIFNNGSVIKDENWSNYLKSRITYNVFFQFNFISNMLQNYTYYGGRSWKDIWFEPESSSKIFFDKQDNLFIAKPTYIFKLNSEDEINENTYDNFIAPYFYVLLQLGFTVINYYIAKNKFKKLDLTA